MTLKLTRNTLFLPLLIGLVSGPAEAQDTTATHRLELRVRDSESGGLLAARVYLQNAAGKWHFFAPASSQGRVARYQKQNWIRDDAVEMHTAISAHPVVARLPGGEYTITVERGKEYFRHRRVVDLQSDRIVTVELRRWIDMAARGWYCGDTHVHRTLEELPTAMLADDVNVAFPLTNWVTQAFRKPSAGDKSAAEVPDAAEIPVDETHVILPRNTEYEIFTIDGQRHTLGALFVLDHRKPLEVGVPPVAEVGRLSREQGALLELDKHNWPWSMALVPLLDVDLFELANNHMWRTVFAFRQFGEAPAEYMKIEMDDGGFTERGWIEFGFENYYALLDCGFRMRPTAGTASGVHPVPLGFGRVYAHVGGEFSARRWKRALDAGRSFVTTGPMLFATLDGEMPGAVLRRASPEGSVRLKLEGAVVADRPIASIEVIRNGEVVARPEPSNGRLERGAFESPIDSLSIEAATSSWICVRAWQKTPTGRWRFAHAAPFHVEVAGRPLRPRREAVDYLVERVRTQIARSRDILPEPAIAEYRKALQAYEALREDAR